MSNIEHGPIQQPRYSRSKKKHTARNIFFILMAGILLMCSVGIVVAVASGSERGKWLYPLQENGTVAGLNTPVRDGKLEFIVKSMTCGTAKVGTDIFSKDAQGQFCIVGLSIRNIGRESFTFMGSEQKAKGSTGVTYSDDPEAEMYANKDHSAILEQINPGNLVEGRIVFDIPKDGKIVSLELHDSVFSKGAVVKL